MKPALSLRNFTPTSTAFASDAAPAGVVVAGQIVIVAGGAAPVVKDQVALAASALPATSLTRGSTPPPLTIAVYVVEKASVALGVKVATRVAAL